MNAFGKIISAALIAAAVAVSVGAFLQSQTVRDLRSQNAALRSVSDSATAAVAAANDKSNQPDSQEAERLRLEIVEPPTLSVCPV